MTIRKQYPGRSYETFEDDENQSTTSGGDADKSQSAAAEARRLASQGSWADNFGTPATDRTPAPSTVDGNEVRDVRYPRMSQYDPSDPPPVYTPSVSTAAPASPVAARSVPEPVSAPNTTSSPSHLPSQPSSRSAPEEEALSPLPEVVDNPHEAVNHEDDEDEDEDSETLPVFLQRQRGRKAKWWRRSKKNRSCGGPRQWWARRQEDKRARRFKKMCFFIFALLLCLLLFIPGLLKSFSHDDRYQLPDVGSKPHDDPKGTWPPEKREHREHETHNSITGTYKLYDLLDLSTVSGSIGITIDVQSGRKPAVLRLSSESGSVNVRMTSSGGFLKPRIVSETTRSRILQTEITTSSGSVSGNIVHGNGGSTSITTKAGSISIDIYTHGVSETDGESTLTTVSDQGSQHIKLFSDASTRDAIRAIEASHSVTGHGSINIDYPPEWEGMVHVTGYGQGSISASGRNLVVNKESSHELYGYRGPKAGKKVEISETGNGSVRFTC